MARPPQLERRFSAFLNGSGRVGWATPELRRGCGSGAGHIDRGGGMLIVHDFKGRHEIADRAQLESLLHKRYNGGYGELIGNYNEFNITHDDELSPYLAVVVRDHIGSIHYFPAEDHPGFRAIGGEPSNDPNADIEFYIGDFAATITSPPEFLLEWDAIVSVVDAFCGSNALPQCIEWFEL
jgi:hypothetical protein